MTLDEAVALQPQWVQVWLVVLTVVTVALPLVLMVWKGTRLAGLIVLAATIAGGVGVQLIFDRMGYVRLIALPHVLLWTPALIYLLVIIRRARIGRWPTIVGGVLAAFITISLVFDYASVARYVAGERQPVNIAS